MSVLERSSNQRAIRATGTQAVAGIGRQLKQAQSLWGPIPETVREAFRLLISRYRLSVATGDLLLLNGRLYVTHSGLLNIAKTRRCFGIRVAPAKEFCDPANGRYAFRATVYKSSKSGGFTGYGDADPSNVSELFHGAELRIAETRAVNRALRKAYGIGICSVEEIGSMPRTPTPYPEPKERKLPPESANGNRNNGHGSNGNANGIRVRDRLCQVIRQHSWIPSW